MEDPPQFNLEPYPFSLYHPNLAKELALTNVPEHVKPFTSRAESKAILWHSIANDSFLSLCLVHMSGSMSPSLDMTIPTLPLDFLEPHLWESAEVVNFDGQQAETLNPDKNPFTSPTERRRIFGNSFFNAQGSLMHVPSKMPDVPHIPCGKKGKEQAVNPFSGIHAEDAVHGSYKHNIFL
ncbi:hypothetical protein EDD18DRAFT_1433010 [Armillaria luteobubalina]|uniref:Uncharacterized protein n=1 Tax=Armillaria luteobubalina TaxID=153913 RepID=A0AA39PFG1_9AGAR|nr:hypothetical protein EDD18DRAFT_1433010 [Armillaria luteobubalina]